MWLVRWFILIKLEKIISKFCGRPNVLFFWLDGVSRYRENCVDSGKVGAWRLNWLVGKLGKKIVQPGKKKA